MSPPNEPEDEKSDEEECAICSNDLIEEFSRPEPCYHRFHTPCITTWAGIRLTCPMCREKFKRIFTYSLENKEHPKLTSTEVFELPQEDVLDQIEMTTGMNPYEHTVCHLCGGGDNEDQILLCDGCDEGFHMYCLTPAVTRIPSGQWMCPGCSVAIQASRSRISRANHSVATRTAGSSRIAAIVTRQLNISSGSEDSEEEDDFSEMDAAVLNDNIEPGTSNLPRVERRKRKRERSTGVKQRRKRRTKRQRRKEKKLLKSLDDSQTRGSKDERADIVRLSINGSGSNHPFFEDEQQKERSTPGSPDETIREKCDLLGSILTEQEKVLANGKLFKVEGGKFKETEEFEKYREKLHKKMDRQHRKRVGMPVDEEEQAKKACRPSSSNANEPNDELMIDDREIDHEVQEQLAQMASDEREDMERELLDAQRKALADQKREELAKKVEKNREQERADREKKNREREREKSQKEAAIIQLGRDRDRERKEREERREREREKDDERRRAREAEADKVKREEERRRRDRNDRRRSRSPRNKDERRRDRTSREVSREDRNDRDENRHSKNERNKEREKQGSSSSNAVQMGQSNGRQAPPTSNNGALPKPFIKNQTRPDMSSIFAAVPGLNPFLPNFGLQLVNPATQMLLAQQQQLAALGALPGTIPMHLPLAGNGIGIPGHMAPIQPTNQPVKKGELKKNEDDKKKGHAVKIIEGHSIRLVTSYFRNEKITREQYKNIMKQLVKEFRNSRSIDELKSAGCKEVIEQRAKELLRPYD